MLLSALLLLYASVRRDQNSIVNATCHCRLQHVYASLGLYHVQLRYTSDDVSPLASSVVVVEELLGDVQLVGPTLVSFVR